MTDAAQHILPVLLLIALGYAIRRVEIVGSAGQVGIDRITYYVLFPALIVLSLATTDFSTFPALAIGMTLLSAVVVMSVVCMALRPALYCRLRCDGPAFTSLFQGATRWNTFIALPLAGSLYGNYGLAVISVAIVAIVPPVNLVCVAVLARYAAKSPPSFAGTLRAVLRNPLIWACIIGIALNAMGTVLPGAVATAMDLVGAAAIPMGLMAVGMGLEPAALRRPKPVLLLSTALKLGLMPAIGLSLALVYGVAGEALGAVAIALSVPTATNAYVLAREMGGDAPLMAEMITFQTAIAMATMPLWIALATG